MRRLAVRKLWGAIKKEVGCGNLPDIGKFNVQSSEIPFENRIIFVLSSLCRL